MSVKSLRTQLLGAIAMVLVATLALGSSTFAWFSLNNKVSVTGMEVKTIVKDNLLIAPAENNTNHSPKSNMPVAGDYGTFLIQHVGTLLEPVSTVDAKYDNFFYTSTTNVVSSGNAKEDEYFDYDDDGLTVTNSSTDARNEFNINYGIGNKTAPVGEQAEGYYDYVFALQATNSGADTQYVNLTKCELTYKGTDTAGYAFRAALLVQAVDETGNTAETGTVNTATILGCTNGTDKNSAYFDYVTTFPQAVNAKNATAPAVPFGDVTNYGALATVDADGIASHTTKYYKCTLRFWLEGEDTTCNNATYAKLTNEWSLDLEFAMAKTKAYHVDDNPDAFAVQAITKANETNTYKLGANTSSSTAVIANVTYYSYTATLVGGSDTITVYSRDADVSGGNSYFYTFNSSLDGEAKNVTNYIVLAD